MDTLMVEYDDMLIGRITAVDSSNFYTTQPGGLNQKRALDCIRYAIEGILCWDVDTAVKKFDEYIIKQMKLSKIISYIDYPIEVPYGNPRYILSLLYPSRVRLNQQTLIEETFRNVLDSDGKQFPRDYFVGGIGFRRYCYCVKYLLENYKPMSSLEEIYEFLCSPDGKTFLHAYRLRTPAYQYSISILETLRYITKDNPDGELYYCFYSFKKAYEKLESENNNRDSSDNV